MMTADRPAETWAATRDTLHQRCRAVGAVAREHGTPLPHWWHVALLPLGPALVTRPLRTATGTEFRIAVDPVAGTARVENPVAVVEHPLGVPTPEFVDWLSTTCSDQGAAVDLDPGDFAAPDILDPGHVAAIAGMFDAVAGTLHRFAEEIGGEQSPVQLWPHHFDMALTWFSGRRVPGIDPGDIEAAAEQITVGFSTGDQAVRAPYVYATAYPQPDELGGGALPPPGRWTTDREGFSGGILHYADAVESGDPGGTILGFLRSFFAEASRLMR
jgi:hypothetical protein